MHHELREFADASAVAAAAAEFVVACSRRSIEANGRFTFAVSGGKTPWTMFEELARMDVAWSEVIIYQVD